MKRKVLMSLLAGTGLVALALLVLMSGSAQAQEEDSGFDHTVLPLLAGPFETANDVTAKCIMCHAVQAEEVMQTIHWTWEWENPETGQVVGKQNVMNNYCVALETNEPRCTSCHIGYGWRDDTFDFADPTNIDCLVCHDTTGTYKKFPTAAGHPVYETTEFSGKTWEPPDLGLIAQNVGATSRETCGSCHFYGGGAAAVKHGDLDPTLVDPSHGLDVHMSADGADFTCTACHTTEAHQIDGSRYDVPMNSTEIDGLTACDSCHVDPHADAEYAAALDMHLENVACETCHIPTYAREMATKMWWDWSTAGQKDAEGKPFQTKDETGEVIYDSMKGDFVWEQNVVPEYVWFNGMVEYTLPDTVIDPSGVVEINTLLGSRDDEKARIWPVKAFRAKQPYDAVNNTLAVPHLFPTSADDSTAYWKVWDWDAAIQTGMKAVGVPYSGEYDFAETVMYWPIAHMVAPAEDALTCNACHSPASRLNWVELGYSEAEAEMYSNMAPAPADE